MEKQLLKELNSVQMIDARAAKLSDYSYPITKSSNRPRSICFAAQGGNYTKSRPGGRRVEFWRQPRVSLILFFLVTFRYFVSEMVLTSTVSIYIICKYGNGEIFTHSEEENGSRHL